MFPVIGMHSGEEAAAAKELYSAFQQMQKDIKVVYIAKEIKRRFPHSYTKLYFTNKKMLLDYYKLQL